MADLVLRRVSATDHATLGVLEAGDHRAFTIERPWADNEPRISCIPPGLYELERHTSERFPDTWALSGGTVSHYPAPGRTRCAILFHAANWASELLGCIAPGMGARVHEAEDWEVTESRNAMERLRGVLRVPGLHTLRVVGVP